MTECPRRVVNVRRIGNYGSQLRLEYHEVLVNEETGKIVVCLRPSLIEAPLPGNARD